MMNGKITMTGTNTRPGEKALSMSEEVHFLDAMFEVNRQMIDEILKYREGGGLERVVETAARLNKLTDEQIRLMQLMINRDKLKAKGK